MNYLVAHDLGTSGDKVTLFNDDGSLIREVTVHYPTHYFHASWAEQDPSDWWDAVCRGTRQVLDGISAKDVCAISFSGHMMGCVCVDQNGQALRPSMIWSDRRAEGQFKQLLGVIDQQSLYYITGHRGGGTYTLPKLMWIKDNEPDTYASTYKVLQVKDYVILKLTGSFATDPTDASQTLAMDIRRRLWSSTILEAAGIEASKFPDILSSTDVAGRVTAAAADATGLIEGTQVVVGGGDGVMASVGTGTVALGQSFLSLGSSAWLSSVSASPLMDERRRVTNSPHVLDGLYLNEGVMQSAGGAYAWAKRTLLEGESSTKGDADERVNRMIESTQPGSNGVLFLPYLLGERCP